MCHGDVAPGWTVYTGMLNDLLVSCQTRPFCYWDGTDWNIVLNAGFNFNLHAILALQLILESAWRWHTAHPHGYSDA